MEFISNVKQGRNFINYAHRGASEYAPENTMLSFMLGETMGANGIETDVHQTKDGALVLFHDDNLKRVTGVNGFVYDYTLAELKNMLVTVNGLSDKICTLDEFLSVFASKKIHLAIELKQANIEKQVIDTLKKYGVQNKTVITSFEYDFLLNVINYAPDFKTGYLTTDTSDEILNRLKKDGFYEICPHADCVDESFIKKAHGLGLNVRAWGVKNVDVMKRAYDVGVDGMTVNFPDKLVDYIASKISTY
ncbi:MAG: hypothetical protein J6B16_02675 [Clostridia bacterium]|nr:hypothetical protein [Clostridia bacterium]